MDEEVEEEERNVQGLFRVMRDDVSTSLTTRAPFEIPACGIGGVADRIVRTELIKGIVLVPRDRMMPPEPRTARTTFDERKKRGKKCACW